MEDNGELAAELDEIENIFTDTKINKVNKKLSLESIYQQKTHLEHVLLRPSMYIGSVYPVTQTMWVYDGEETGMINREVTFVPGLFKIFDEILVNAADNKHRDKNMDCIKIEIDPEKNKVSVWNNGKGIPVVEHKDAKMLVPSLIFGHLLTSSNFNDEKKVTGGRNGYGAKLCNIFSNKFTVETSCKQNNKCFKQTWSDNMSTASDPKIVPAEGEDFTCITFYPDLKIFEMEMLDKDIVALMSRRAYDIAGCAKGVRVQLNGKKLPVKTFKDYVDLYTKNKVDENGDPLKIVYESVSDRWEVAATISDDEFQQVSFVNNFATTKGGRHVEYVVDQLTAKIVEAVNKKNKGEKEVEAFQIKTHIWVFVNCLIENPTFDSQIKENMTLQVKNFGSKCVLPEKFITSVLKCGVEEAVVSWLRFEEFYEVRFKMYEKRMGYLTAKLGAEALKLSNQARFISEIFEKKLIIEGLRKVEMIKTLQDRGYDSDPVKAWKEAQKLQNEDDQETGSDSEEEAATPGADYDYLLGMTMLSFTREKAEELLKKRDEKTQDLETLESKSSSDLCLEDLELFMDELEKKEKDETSVNAFFEDQANKGALRVDDLESAVVLVLDGSSRGLAAAATALVTETSLSRMSGETQVKKEIPCRRTDMETLYNELKFISWNVGGLNEKNLPLRTEAICKRIIEEQADVVFLQEVVPESAAYYVEHLTNYECLFGGEIHYFLGTFLKKSTVKVESHNLIDFPNTRMMRNILKVNAQFGQVPLRLMNAHLESTADAAHSEERKNQLRMALKEAHSAPDNRSVIFAGDMSLSDKELNEIGGLPAGIEDVWVMCGSRESCSYTWDMLRNDNLICNEKFKPRCRFDRVYFRGSSPSKMMPKFFGLIGLERLLPHVCFPSDHWGILSHFGVA